MSENLQTRSWLKAIEDAAKEKGLALPLFTRHGMGGARTVNGGDGRFITFKRRLVSQARAEVDGIEWTLWWEHGDLPTPVAAFREPLHPEPQNVTVALPLLVGWLLEGWTPEQAKAAVRKHPRAQEVENLVPPAGGEQLESRN